MWRCLAASPLKGRTYLRVDENPILLHYLDGACAILDVFFANSSSERPTFLYIRKVILITSLYVGAMMTR
jgi:hypothetical protein